MELLRRLPTRLQALLGRRPPTARVGVQMFDDGLILVALDPAGERLQVCEYVSGSRNEHPELLAELVARHELAGAPTVVVAGDGDYQTQQLEAPDVPPEEMAAATRLRAKDVIDFPLEQARVVALRQQSDRARSNEMMFVAIARAQRVEDMAATVVDSGLDLLAIVPREMAVTTLSSHLPDPSEAVALVLLGPNSGLVSILRNGELYLARALPMGTEELASQGELGYESLVLELQRSLDYYESQLASASASRVLMAPTGEDLGPLLDHLTNSLPVPAAALDIDHLVECGEEQITPAGRAHGILALVAALPALETSDKTFYTPPVRTIDWLGADAMAGYAAAMVVGLGLVALVLTQGLERAETAAAGAEARQQNLAEQVGEAERALEDHQPARALRREYQRLASRLEANRELMHNLDDLAGGVGRVGIGFSDPLAAFGRHRLDGVWLREIRLSPPYEARLVGSTLAPERLPRYLERLSEDSALAGHNFQLFELDRAPESERLHDEQLDFRIATRRGEQP